MFYHNNINVFFFFCLIARRSLPVALKAIAYQQICDINFSSANQRSQSWTKGAAIVVQPHAATVQRKKAVEPP